MTWRSLRAFSMHGSVRTIALGGHPLQIAGDGRVISPVGEELHKLLSRSSAFVWDAGKVAPAPIPVPDPVPDPVPIPAPIPASDPAEAETDPPHPATAEPSVEDLKELLTSLSSGARPAAPLDDVDAAPVRFGEFVISTEKPRRGRKGGA